MFEGPQRLDRISSLYSEAMGTVREEVYTMYCHRLDVTPARIDGIEEELFHEVRSAIEEGRIRDEQILPFVRNWLLQDLGPSTKQEKYTGGPDVPGMPEADLEQIGALESMLQE